MALKTLMIKRNLDLKRAELEKLRALDAEFATREAELEKAIDEAATEDEQSTVSEEIEKYEADKAAHDETVTKLAGEIEQLEADLAAAEAAAPTPARSVDKAHTQKIVERNEKMTTVNIRALPIGRGAFEALPAEQRTMILERDDVKAMLAKLRSMKGQNRGITGGELEIPVVLLELIAENTFRYSKLLNRVRVRDVAGTTRQTIAGTIPEAVWMEMCGAMNELELVFNQVELDGYKVGGYVPVCNSMLEDSDANLASYIVEAISEAIGLATDKAILYGKGRSNRMPLGIVTRLAQTVEPSGYDPNAPAWVDLHTSNIIKIGGDDVTGAAFWSQLVEATGATHTNYSRGEMFWAMNTKTYTQLKSKLITFTANGEITAALYGVLPIVTGNIDILEFMPDGDIVGGYGDLYLWANRAGMVIEQSEHVQFIQDNTVFRGKRRADGMPIIPGAFVAININNIEVTTTMTFAADNANDAQLTGLSIAGVTLSPSFDPTVLNYTGGTATNNSAKVEATPAQASASVAVSVNGANLRNGGTAALKASASNTIAVTVRNGNAVRVYTVTVTGAAGG